MTTDLLDILIIGAGPIGLACALEAQKRGYRYLVIEKGCLVNSIFQYPYNMRFFSTPDLLEIGGVPFICSAEKPTRKEALEYYRRVAQGLGLKVQVYEKVLQVQGSDGAFEMTTTKGTYQARKVIVAIGFYDHPRLLNVPGEDLPKVTHYYREAHPYSEQNLLIVGSGNSAVIAALECHRHGARVTLAVRKADFHEGIKYWLRPDIDNRIQSGEITAHFNTRLQRIDPQSVTLLPQDGKAFAIPNDFVLALTGYEPDYGFLKSLGIAIEPEGYRPPVHHPETYETNRSGLYLAGVVIGGLHTNKWFIENSRQHAQAIFEHLETKLK